MHIEYLKFFHDVSSMGSISKVANTCHISQPALSQQIQKLEDSLGFKLLTRSNKGVEITKAGQVVEKYAKSIIKSYDHMIEDLAALNNSNNTIRIDSSPTIANYALPCTVFLLKEEFPEYKINLTTNQLDDVENNILNGFCDFGIIHGKPLDGCGLSHFRIGTDRIVAVAAKDYPVKDESYLKDLQGYKLIMLLEKYKISQDIKRHFHNANLTLDQYNILFNLDSIESVKSTVIKGYGLSFLPYISVKKELYTKQLKEVRILDSEMSYDISLVYHQDKDMNICIKKCIQHFKKVGEKSFC